jgi:hypothetical protein
LAPLRQELAGELVIRDPRAPRATIAVVREAVEVARRL